MIDPPEDPDVVRLGREEQKAIARGLREWYQHVVDEGIPEHMKARLEEMLSGEQSQAQSVEAAAARPGAKPGARAEPEQEPPPERPEEA